MGATTITLAQPQSAQHWRQARGIVAEAQRLGYARLLLDTLPFMQEAQSLYASLGFRKTAAYRFNPLPGATYFELSLR